MSTNAGARFKGFKQTLVRTLEFLASKMCSKHGKRILFISSLYVQVTQLERMKADTVSKLNRVMGLNVRREEAVHFPAVISSLVWRGMSVGAVLSREMMSQHVDDQRVREVSAKVVEISPRWLRYGEGDMINDVAKFILNGHELAAA